MYIYLVPLGHDSVFDREKEQLLGLTTTRFLIVRKSESALRATPSG